MRRRIVLQRENNGTEQESIMPSLPGKTSVQEYNAAQEPPKQRDLRLYQASSRTCLPAALPPQEQTESKQGCQAMDLSEPRCQPAKRTCRRHTLQIPCFDDDGKCGESGQDRIPVMAGVERVPKNQCDEEKTWEEDPRTLHEEFRNVNAEPRQAKSEKNEHRLGYPRSDAETLE